MRRSFSAAPGTASRSAEQRRDAQVDAQAGFSAQNLAFQHRHAGGPPGEQQRVQPRAPANRRLGQHARDGGASVQQPAERRAHVERAEHFAQFQRLRLDDQRVGGGGGEDAREREPLRRAGDAAPLEPEPVQLYRLPDEVGRGGLGEREPERRRVGPERVQADVRAAGPKVESGREPQRDGCRAGGVGEKGCGLRRWYRRRCRRGGHVEIGVAVGVAEADGGPLHARRVGAAGPEPGLARAEVEVEARRFEQVARAAGGERKTELEHVGAERAELSAGRLSRSAERDPIRPHDAVDAECGAAEVGDAGQKSGERAGLVELDLKRERLGRLDLVWREV